jgi:hypothetical protein
MTAKGNFNLFLLIWKKIPFFFAILAKNWNCSVESSNNYANLLNADFILLRNSSIEALD